MSGSTSNTITQQKDQQKLEEFQSRIKEGIQEFGWMVQCVAPVVDDPQGNVPFAYTIGLTERQLPELYLHNVAPNQATEILNALAKHVSERGQAPSDGELLDIGWNVKFRVRGPIDTTRAEMTQAENLYGPSEVNGFQVLWPDRAGHFPGEDGYDSETFGGQELAATA